MKGGLACITIFARAQLTLRHHNVLGTPCHIDSVTREETKRHHAVLRLCCPPIALLADLN